MATWSAFTVGGLDPIATDWQRSRDRKDAEWSAEQQREYDTWSRAVDYNYSWLNAAELQPFTYKQDLLAQNKYYDLEQNLRYERAEDNVLAQRRALENAGYNPLLAVDNVAGGLSASPLVAGAGTNSARSHGGVSVGGINRTPTGNSGISGGTPWDFATARQNLENAEQTGELISAQVEETLARAAVARNTADKIKRETDLVGYENPTRTLKSISNFIRDNIGDIHPASSASQLLDSIKTLFKGTSDDSGSSKGSSGQSDTTWGSISKNLESKLLDRFGGDIYQHEVGEVLEAYKQGKELK